MEHCTAEEWYVADRARYDRFTEYFSGSGTLAIGGQAGIAALHLAGLGAGEVFCLAPALGRTAALVFARHNVRVPEVRSGTGPGQDTTHLIFEYPPGLVPLADGAQPRNNRFIISPDKSAKNTLLPEETLQSVLLQVSSCTRAFLSGYQYLSAEQEFARAAGQIQALKRVNPLMRVHIEWVSVTSETAIAGLMRHILPAADSLGLNEHELTLLPGQAGTGSPVSRAEGILTLAQETGLSRIHLHTFGYYLLVIRKDRAIPQRSRQALMYAAKVVADAARGTTTSIPVAGIDAVRQIAGSFAPGSQPGVFSAGEYLVIAVPTPIAAGITQTVGLGDILSSTAFAADQGLL
jgi:ADP-dependent phosphofructokinase/glucokinase